MSAGISWAGLHAAQVIEDQARLDAHRCAALKRRIQLHFALDPLDDQLNGIGKFSPRQLASGLDVVPLLHAVPAAQPQGVLGNKDRITSHGRLVSVVGNKGAGQAFRKYFAGMPAHRLQARSANSSASLAVKMKTASKCAFGKSSEELFDLGLRAQGAGALDEIARHAPAELCGILSGKLKGLVIF